MMQKISNRIYSVGVNDHDKALFEGLWPLPYGVSYNSYVVTAGKVALIDTVESGFEEEFLENIEGAAAAGVEVGVYFFTQAIDEREAVEEASMVLNLVSGYNLSYPIFIDTENGSGNARANGLDKATRTKCIAAFCKTIQNSGKTAGIYASKSWLENNLIMSYLNQYDVWLARYAAAPEYTGPFTIWQYTSKGAVDGISGYVDRNIGYKRYY